MGMVAGRVFETLASGTPMIQYRHRELQNVLGFPYPYQTSSREETERLLEKMFHDYPKTLAIFRKYAGFVKNYHSYMRRIEVLFNKLEEWK